MKELNRVHLNGLRALEAVGRLGSLRRAAAEFGVSQGAVSQHVIRTEAQLGRTVFERTGRGLVPTVSGSALLARLSDGFRALDEAVAATRSHPDHILTVSVAPVFASKWLVPRLARYASRHPGVQVRLDASVELVNPDISDIDIAIRVGPGGWPGVKLDFLMPQEVFPVCSPDLAARIAEPADLLRLPVVEDANSVLSWDMWLGRFGFSARDMRPGNSFTDASLALDAAIAGQGVFLAWPTLAEYALSVGTLVAPFAERAATGLSYWLVSSATRRDPPRVAAFRRWIKEEIAETEKLFPSKSKM